MKTVKKSLAAKRSYTKPECKRIRIDNQISMVMMSSEGENPPSDPSTPQSHYPLNPFK